MEDAPQFALFEHAVGYSLFKVKEFEDIGLILPEVCISIFVHSCFIYSLVFITLKKNNLKKFFKVRQSVDDVQRFQSIVQLLAFEPFKNTESALINAKDVSEG